MICPSCNTTNRDDARFCKGCGRPLRTGSAGQQEQTAQTAQNIQDAQQVQDVQSAQDAALPAQANVTAPEPADASLEPTLILSPEKMVAYHARRWSQEAQPDQTNYADFSTSPPPSPSNVPAETTPPAPQSESALIAPPPPPESMAAAPSLNGGSKEAVPAQDEQQVQQGNGASPEATTSETEAQPSAQADVEPPAETAEQEPSQPAINPPDQNVVAPLAGAMSDATPGAISDAVPAGATSNATTGEEQDQQQAPETGQSSQEFPVLPVGALLLGRYEVTGVISDDAHEHVYHVVDHQGYQRCWSCGYEQNAEGDEFCGECGASLLDAPYILHEYSSEQSLEDATVMHGTIVNTFVDQGRTYAVEQEQTEQNAFPNGVFLEAATASDAGDVRRSDPNEDSTLVMHFQRIHESMSSPVGVFIVADGMGGHANGQGASRMTINIIAERLARDLLLAPLIAEKDGQPVTPFDDDALVTLLHSAVQDANTALCQKNAQEKSDMGSTVTGCMVVGQHAYIVNVGDSRTYMVRNKQLYQVTTDHSLVAQLVAGGLIEPDDVYTHPQRSQIYRSLGDKQNLQIDIFKQELLPGDILLSCCDGVWEMVRNPQIESILNNAPDPQTACAQLIDAANAGGGEDNISAIVVFVR
jgi:serine/threonine protein phosphatase PrpC